MPESNNVRVFAKRRYQVPAILAPVKAHELEAIIASEYVLGLVQADVVHLDHLFGNCSVSFTVEWVKLDATHLLVTVFLNDVLLPRIALIDADEAVLDCHEQVCLRAREPAQCAHSFIHF